MLALVASAALLAWARGGAREGPGARGRAGSRSPRSSSGSRRSCCRGSSTANLGFGPADGGFASVFVGWSGLFAVTVLGAMVWLEMVRRGGVSQRLERRPVRAGADLDAVGFYLAFLAGLGAVTFAFLYLL